MKTHPSVNYKASLHVSQNRADGRVMLRECQLQTTNNNKLQFVDLNVTEELHSCSNLIKADEQKILLLFVHRTIKLCEKGTFHESESTVYC